jgi:hypothetical protein
MAFDYSAIRPAGAPVKVGVGYGGVSWGAAVPDWAEQGFGGTTPGPTPLQELHEALRDLLNTHVVCRRADVCVCVYTCVCAYTCLDGKGRKGREHRLWLGSQCRTEGRGDLCRFAALLT